MTLLQTVDAIQHYNDVIMSPMASQFTSLTIVYSTVYSGADQRKHQSSASLAFVRGIHRGPVNSPHKWPVTRKRFPFDDVIMKTRGTASSKTTPGLRLNAKTVLPCMGIITTVLSISWYSYTGKSASWYSGGALISGILLIIDLGEKFLFYCKPITNKQPKLLS